MDFAWLGHCFPGARGGQSGQGRHLTSYHGGHGRRLGAFPGQQPDQERELRGGQQGERPPGEGRGALTIVSQNG